MKNPKGEVLLEEIFGSDNNQNAVLEIPKKSDDEEIPIEAEKEIITETKAPTPEKPKDPDEPHKLPYVFPPLTLLRANQGGGGTTQAEILYTAEKLVKVLDSFGVHTKVINTNCGPKVTRY